MDGSLIYVMGPSGAGKDSLIKAAKIKFKDSPGLKFVRRYITREDESGSEDNLAVSQFLFDQLENSGEFIFSWRSHGLSYGIPGLEVKKWLEEGRVAVMNGSRAYLPRALKIIPDLRPILVTARPEVIVERLKARGREDQAATAERLKPLEYKFPEINNLPEIDNSGNLSEAAAVFCDFLQQALNEAGRLQISFIDPATECRN
ncbi:MAG: phosphonate metabolism protein/1,5-bisphosphokinase (PRPP-forming) PhnN [Candidatus Adiutrix sp.]|jgi:ribose 1,5-bisphosphokinase|nr:phosphonate metabolism protein/1,5-bisphosphokinase (PRPP-forming) PhnN [Candidatus Adiutrix sp.]